MHQLEEFVRSFIGIVIARHARLPQKKRFSHKNLPRDSLCSVLVLWQIKVPGERLKLLKHSSQLWLSLAGSLERVIIWYFFFVLHSENGEPFPLNDIVNDILELYLLMLP